VVALQPVEDHGGDGNQQGNAEAGVGREEAVVERAKVIELGDDPNRA